MLRVGLHGGGDVGEEYCHNERKDGTVRVATEGGGKTTLRPETAQPQQHSTTPAVAAAPLKGEGSRGIVQVAYMVVVLCKEFTEEGVIPLS